MEKAHLNLQINNPNNQETILISSNSVSYDSTTSNEESLSKNSSRYIDLKDLSKQNSTDLSKIKHANLLDPKDTPPLGSSMDDNLLHDKRPYGEVKAQLQRHKRCKQCRIACLGLLFIGIIIAVSLIISKHN